MVNFFQFRIYEVRKKKIRTLTTRRKCLTKYDRRFEINTFRLRFCFVVVIIVCEQGDPFVSQYTCMEYIMECNNR